MSTTYELMERIQKYDGVDKFLILNKNGNKLNTDGKEEDKGKASQIFSNNYTDIPKIVDKSISMCRDLNPLNELSFIQINYSGYDYLITQDEDLYVFTAIRTGPPTGKP